MLEKETARGRGVNVPTIVPTIVPTEHYKVRHIRMDDMTWEQLKYKRRKSQLSWNLFIKDLINFYGDKCRNPNKNKKKGYI